MNSSLVPVLVTKYSDSLYTARVIDGPEADVAASTAAECFRQVKMFLRKQGERATDVCWPSIERYELRQTTVEVRLLYRDGKRQFPASREMKVPARYVLGFYSDSSVECFIVDYGVEYHCANIDEASKLVGEAVRSLATSLSSRDLATASAALESEIRLVRVRLRSPEKLEKEDLTPTLSLVADPLTSRRGKHHSSPIKHRENDIGELLTAMKLSSVLLVGAEGCGKTSIALQAAKMFQTQAKQQAKTEGKTPPPPLVWHSSAENLIAGMQYLGQWEQRSEAVIAELESIGGMLLVPSLVDLVRLGGCQPTDSIAAFLMPFVRRGEVRILAETDAEQLDATRRLLPGWAECFQMLHVAPLTTDQTLDIAGAMLSEAARNHHLTIDPTAAPVVTRLFARYMPYQSPPRGVVSLIGDCLDRVKRQLTQAKQLSTFSDDTFTGEVSTAEFTSQFTKQTGLPEVMLADTHALQRDDVRDWLGQQVIGQCGAVDVAADVVLRLKAGLCDPRRPVSTLLFCGPTGVGKTQLARSLAEYLFGQAERSDKPLIRLDMSEYAGWDSVERFLMGASGEVAPWVGRLRARPMSVLLLDEFEKSSQEVHDCLLSALDEGRLTDRFGRTTTLCGAIVVMTSNVGSRSTAAVGFNDGGSSEVRHAIEQEFRPEFLNRIDEIVQFESLGHSVVRKIVEKELSELTQRESLVVRRVQLKWDNALVDRLVSIGFDSRFGARPLQRVIERDLVSKIARQLLDAGESTEPLIIDLSAI